MVDCFFLMLFVLFERTTSEIISFLCFKNEISIAFMSTKPGIF